MVDVECIAVVARLGHGADVVDFQTACVGDLGEFLTAGRHLPRRDVASPRRTPVCLTYRAIS